MNKVQQKIHDEIVKPALERMSGNVIGRVLTFNNETQTGTVEFSAGANAPIQAIPDVPYMALSGVKQSCPLPDTDVLIGFLGGSHRYPYMYGRVDMRHIARTRADEHEHKRTGSNVTEVYSHREGEYWHDIRSL